MSALAQEHESPSKAETLNKADDKASKRRAVDEYANLSHKAQKVKDNERASIKYGLDY